MIPLGPDNCLSGLLRYQHMSANIVLSPPSPSSVPPRSGSDASFNVQGLWMALLSTAAQTGLNVKGKTAADATKVTGFSAFFLMVVRRKQGLFL